MASELNVQEQQQVRKSSRRFFLKWGVLGGLVVFPICLSVCRYLRSSNLYAKEVPCSLEYKRYTGKSLLELLQGTKVGPYSIHSLYVREGSPDCLFFDVKFPDSIPLESLVNFSVQLYSIDGKMIGQMLTILKHPHYVAPEWRNLGNSRFSQFGTTDYAVAQIYLLHGNSALNVDSISLAFGDIMRTK